MKCQDIKKDLQDEQVFIDLKKVDKAFNVGEKCLYIPDTNMRYIGSFSNSCKKA